MEILNKRKRKLKKKKGRKRKRKKENYCSQSNLKSSKKFTFSGDIDKVDSTCASHIILYVAQLVSLKQ